MPPTSTPVAAPLAAVADQAPSALRRAAGSVNVVVIRLSVAGARIAPPMPCTARAAISDAPFCARPPTRLNNVNTANPDRNTRRRPNKSAARPPSSRKPAKVSV
jgi:hypothetical protein